MFLRRIWDDKRNIIMADCDDDGETAASSRMLHLMDVNSRWDELKIFYQRKILDFRRKECISRCFKMVRRHSIA